MDSYNMIHLSPSERKVLDEARELDQRLAASLDGVGVIIMSRLFDFIEAKERLYSQQIEQTWHHEEISKRLASIGNRMADAMNMIADTLKYVGECAMTNEFPTASSPLFSRDEAIQAARLSIRLIRETSIIVQKELKELGR